MSEDSQIEKQVIEWIEEWIRNLFKDQFSVWCLLKQVLWLSPSIFLDVFSKSSSNKNAFLKIKPVFRFWW
jgi:hypothetical protein